MFSAHHLWPKGWHAQSLPLSSLAGQAVRVGGGLFSHDTTLRLVDTQRIPNAIYAETYSMKNDFDTRAEFERWYSDEFKYPQSVERSSSGSYKLMAAHLAWTAWNEAITRFVAWVPMHSDYQDDAIQSGVGSGA